MPVNYFNVENGVAGFTQKDYQTKSHAHFSIEIAFSLSGTLDIYTDNQEYSHIQAAIIGSNVLHTFSCLASECQIYFIDPTATIAEQILKHYHAEGNDLTVLDTVGAKKLKEERNFIAGKDNHLFLHTINRDDRIQKCLEWIEINYMEERINISTLSEIFFLSESRLTHLFKEQIGISIHQYILWKKIEMAAKRSLEGYSLTNCAHFSGFTDSSHFNKIFKKMFGVNPSFALKKG